LGKNRHVVYVVGVVVVVGVLVIVVVVVVGVVVGLVVVVVIDVVVVVVVVVVVFGSKHIKLLFQDLGSEFSDQLTQYQWPGVSPIEVQKGV
jgi:hypothetical protein